MVDDTNYSLSCFQPPFLQFGANADIPYWSYGGSALATENYIRLTPAMGSRIGWLWNEEPVQMKNWEVTLEFDIHNKMSPGADGIAFWYSKRNKRTGVLVGQEESFEGLGIIFDTYDNNANGDGPSVVAVRGQSGHPVQWDYDNDFMSNQLARCRADFRNAAASTVKAKITYRDGSLSVSTDTMGRGEYTFCFQVDRLNLPQGYYFGITAATGGLSDYHDVYRFESTDLDMDDEEEDESESYVGRKKKRFDPYEFYERELRKLEQEQKLKNEKAEEEASDDEDPYGIEAPKHKNGQKERRPPSAQKKKNKIKETRKNHKENELDEKAFFDGLKAKMKSLDMGNEDAEQLKSSRQKSKQKKDDPTHIAFSNEAVMYIMDGLQQVTRVVRDASTREDINNIIHRVEQVAKAQQSVSENINGVGRDIKEEVTSMSNSIEERTTELATEITRLQSLLHRLEQKVHGLTERQGTLHQDIQRTTHTFRDDIRKESSFTFWIFFILFQIAFFAAIIFWRRMRETKTRWLA